MCYMMVDKRIGEQIKELRKERNLTQEELAELLKVSPNYIAMIETGRRQGKFILQKIADALGVESSVISGDKPIPLYTPKPKPFKSFMREMEAKYHELEIRELPILGQVPCRYPLLVEQEAEHEYGETYDEPRGLPPINCFGINENKFSGKCINLALRSL